MQNKQPFIVIEGPDGVGKTTLVRGLCQRFITLGVTPRPIRNPPADLLAPLLSPASSKETSLLVAVAAHTQLIYEHVGPALRAGEVPIMDRYTLSSYIYQCRLQDTGVRAFCARWQALASHLPAADLTLVLGADIGTLSSRLDDREKTQPPAAKKKKAKEQPEDRNKFEKDLMTRERILFHYMSDYAAWLADEAGYTIYVDTTDRGPGAVEEIAWERIAALWSQFQTKESEGSDEKAKWVAGF